MAANPAPLEMNCPTCDTRLRVQRSAIGKHARCPRCKTSFAVSPPVPPKVDGEVRVVPIDRTARPKVFISHSHQDRDFVQQTIKPLLESHDIEAWWSRNIPGGAQWEKEVRKHLH